MISKQDMTIEVIQNEVVEVVLVVIVVEVVIAYLVRAVE